MTHLLIVEDSPTQAQSLRFQLEDQGFEVRLAATLAEGMEQLESALPDVVLLDLILPDCTDLLGLERIREMHPHVPVVVLTSMGDETLAIEALQAGAQDYVVKGSQDSSLLVRTIRHAIERARNLQQLETLTVELQSKNQKLEDLNGQKDRFLGMAAHDMRNPLGLIDGYSKFLLELAAHKLDEEELDVVSRIQQSAQFMLHLIDELLDISAIESGNLELDLEPLDLVPLVEEIVTTNALLARSKDIAVRSEPAVGSAPAHVDVRKVYQVLNNLISNAVKFSHSGSTVTVQVGLHDGEIVIAVRDEGQGIPADELPSVFQPFQKTSVRSTGGESSTGLGLAIVRRIVDGHGGRMSVESAVGEGSTFSVILPADSAVKTGVATPSE